MTTDHHPDSHTNAAAFSFGALVTFLTGSRVAPEDLAAIAQVTYHLTNSTTTEADLGALTGFWEPYPGATHSLYELLREAILLQQPHLRDLPEQLSGTISTEWLADMAHQLGYDSPEDQLTLTALRKDNTRINTVVVAHGKGGVQLATFVTGGEGENIDRHERHSLIEAARQKLGDGSKPLDLSCIYYLQARSYWLDSEQFAVLAATGGCYNYDQLLTDNPFTSNPPPLNAELLRPAATPPTEHKGTHRAPPNSNEALVFKAQ